MNTEYLTVAEFAGRLRVHHKTIARWIEEGKLAYWQVGNSRSIRIPASELNRHIHPLDKKGQQGATRS